MSKVMSNIYFLGYGNSKIKLIHELKKRNCKVKFSDKAVTLNDVLGSDLIISFGYRYILKPNLIDNCNCPILNLHMSYLPYNRGSHPNFWSFYEGTQSGISIHLIDRGIDTGPILFQKKINFSKKSTFVETYSKLFKELENLFIANINLILSKKWIEQEQIGKGTFHLEKDLPSDFKGWDTIIIDEINRLKN